MAVSLQQYIETRGVHKVAALCRVTTQTVYNWQNNQTPPDAFMCYLMIEDSMSMLTYDSILNPYVLANFEKISEHKAKGFTADELIKA